MSAIDKLERKFRARELIIRALSELPALDRVIVLGEFCLTCGFRKVGGACPENHGENGLTPQMSNPK